MDTVESAVHLQRTLLLSQGYEPLGAVPWQRAVTLIFAGKAEVVEEYEDHEIHSVTMAIKMPSVVRFLNAVRRRKQTPKFSRQNIHTRDQQRCQYCGRKVPLHEATYDHVLPRRLGGKTCWDNVVIACGGANGCNSRKGGRTPEQAGMRLLKLPVRPRQLTMKLTLMWNKSMPVGWRQFLADRAYWNGTLDTD
jgi:5-methylcytosine-specific restriction endonuclease McrA